MTTPTPLAHPLAACQGNYFDFAAMPSAAGVRIINLKLQREMSIRGIHGSALDRFFVILLTPICPYLLG
jgi:hypothetical protein